MLDYDKEILDFIDKMGGLYRRYSDDIVVICPTENEDAVEEFVMAAIKKYQLDIQKAKTQKTRFADGKLVSNEQPVKYLGFEFDGKLVRLKSTSVSKYYRNMKKLVKFKARRAQKMKSKYPERAFIFRKPIYKGYSHLGARSGSNRKRNYISYVNRSAQVIPNNAIKKQLSKSWRTINNEIDRYTKKYQFFPLAPDNYFLTGEIAKEGIKLQVKAS
jgi:hypothetical protein